MNDWMAEQNYEPFCHVVEVTPKRYRVELLADDGEVRLSRSCMWRVHAAWLYAAWLYAAHVSADVHVCIHVCVA